MNLRILLLFGLILFGPGVREIVAASVWYVDASVSVSGNGQSWAEAKRTLTEGLAAATANQTPPHEVWVRGGTYTLPYDTSSFQLKAGVRVYGGFQGTEVPATFDPDTDPRTNNTTLSGALGSAGFSDNVRIIVRGASNSSTFLLDGFTIAGAAKHAIWNPSDADGTYRNLVIYRNHTINDTYNTSNPPNQGTGIHVSGSDPRIENCTFESNQNSAPGGSGGAAIGIDGGTNVQISGCTFLENKVDGPDNAGGGAIWVSGSARVENSQFTLNSVEGNSGFGGAIYSDGDSPPMLIVQSDFTSNSLITSTSSAGGGACYFQKSGGIVNCSFTRNLVSDEDDELTGRGGGVYFNGAEAFDVYMVNCLYYGNHANTGGGLYANKANNLMSNCTFVSNGAKEDGAGAYIIANDAENCRITNSIFWDNQRDFPSDPTVDEPAQLWVDVDPFDVIRYSSIQGLIPSGDFDNGDNKEAKPFFVNLGYGDLHLTSASLCIDVGSNSLIALDVADIDSNSGTTVMPLDLDLECRRDSTATNCGGTVDLGVYEYEFN